MKEEIKGDAELVDAFDGRDRRPTCCGALEGIRARAAVPRRSGSSPYRQRVRQQGDLVARVRLPDVAREPGADHRGAARLPRDRLRLPGDARGREGRPRGGGARADGRRARGRGPRAAPGSARALAADEPAHARPPLLHRPGHERAPAARARSRSAASSSRPVALDDPEDVIFLALQRAPRPHGEPRRRSTRGRSSRERRDERERAFADPPARVGRDGDARRSSTSRTTPSGASRRSSTASRQSDRRPIHGLAASPGVVEGTARLVGSLDEFDQVQNGEILVCQMTNPAWVVLFTKIGGPRHRRRRRRLAPGRGRPRVRDPGRRRHVRRDRADHDAATACGSTARPASSRFSSVSRRR